MDTISEEEWKLLFDNVNAYINSQALITACDLDLFSTLAEFPGLILIEISEKLNISYYSARVLMLCCCNTKLVYRDQYNRYYNSSAAHKMLNSNNPNSMLGYIKFNQKIQMPTLKYFTESIKTNTPQGLDAFPGSGNTLYERLASHSEYEEIFQNGLGSYSLCMSSRLLAVNEFSNAKNILDLAGGDATIEILLCEEFPQIKINILEIPTVCARTNERLKKMNLHKKIQCIPCDVFQDEWIKGCDTIFVSHFVEIFTPEKIISLYKKISGYLPSSGMFILWTATAHDNEDAGLQAAKSSMYFLTTAGGKGFTYTLDEHKQWLNEADLTISNIYHFSDIEHKVIIATKK